MKITIKYLALTAVFLSSFLWSGLAQAEESIQISPLTYKFEVKPGETKEATLTARNLSDKALNYGLEAENFSDVTDAGAPVSFEKSDGSGQSLADWITYVSPKEGKLEAKEKKSLNFNISVPSDAKAGGYYAAVFVRVTEIEGQSAFGVAGRVGALILVTVPGEITKSVKYDASTMPSFVGRLSTEKKFTAKVKNAGGNYLDANVIAEIKPLFGKKSVIDLGTHTIIQGNARNYEAIWGNKYPFGYYKVTFKTLAEGKELPEVAKGSFWALPLEIVLPALVLLAGLVFLFVLIIRKKRTAN